MDSSTPHCEPNDDSETEHALASLLSWARSIKPLHRVLSVLVVSLVFAALGFSSLPLWRPMGALVLHKLWEVLRFLVLTTSIGLGILNSRLWRGTCSETNSVALNSATEDSLSSKAPFAGVFYGEAQHSYSFSDKETEPDERVSMSSNESERHVGLGTNVASLTGLGHDVRVMGGELDHARAATLTDGHHGNGAVRASTDHHQPHTQHATLPVNGPTTAVSAIKSGITQASDGISANHTSQRRHGKEDADVNEEASVHPPHDTLYNAVNVVSRGQSRLVKPYDDLGLATVAQQPKQHSRKIVHRRGSSLEFPIAQEWGASILENGTATNYYQSMPQEELPSSEKVTSSTAFNVAVQSINKKGTEPSGSIPAAHRRTKHSDIDGAISGVASKHSRSQSAYNLNELLEQQDPRSKPSTSSQLSKRRNVSLSCDLDKEHAIGGTPPWLSSLPSPPEPPLIYGYDIVESRLVSADVDRSEQDESSLRKAFTESLAPWRAATNHTVPVNIPKVTHKEDNQSKKDPSAKTMKVSTAIMENQMVSTPSSSPTTSTTMGSPSPGELNKKVDAFIARFHQRIRLQRLESLERSKQRGL